MADYVSGEEKCEARKDVDADTVRGYMTFRCGLPIGHPGSHQVERVVGGPLIWEQSAEHTLQTGGPGMQPCGNVGPFDGITCKRTVGHSGHHKHTAAGTTSVWSDVTEESVARQLASLQRKVRAQANQIIKLEELRRAAVAKQPEHRELADQLRLQIQLTMRENALRKQAETERNNDRERRAELIGNLLMDIRVALGDPTDFIAGGGSTWSELRKQVSKLTTRVTELDRDRRSERERGERFQEELRRALAKPDSAESAERTRRFVARFYRLASLLGVNTVGETWDTLLQRVADLRAELEVERVRANARKAELDKQGARLTGHDAVRMFMGPSAEYGTTPLAARVAELAKDLDSVSRVVAVLNDRLSKLETGAVSRCESRHGDQRCVMFVGHMGPHHAGPEAERWV